MEALLEKPPGAEVAVEREERVLHIKDKQSPQTIAPNVYNDLLELKNSRKKTDEAIRPMVMAISLCISLALVIVAFNWKTYDEPDVVGLGNLEGDFDEIVEVPLSVQPPPPPPQKVENFVLKEVEDEEILEEVDLDLDVEVTENMKVTEIIYDDLYLDAPEEKVEEIFQIVEDQPTFPGGLEAFYKFVSENIEYPALARRLGVSGRVFVKFVVEKNGELTQIEVVKGIGSGCDEEAVRVLKESPTWTPGKQRGRAVRVYLTVPILFVLKEN